MSKHVTPPARGEDNALQGYDAQYAVASEIILQALRSDDFECVILKDINAEKVDDIQIVKRKRVDAYQVKWHVPPISLTPSMLKGSDNAPENGLVRLLADGWTALNTLHSGKEVFVHLYTTSYASTSSIGKIPKTQPPPRHLSGFLDAYWKAQKPTDDTLNKWQPFIQEIRKASGLSSVLFEKFRIYCKFDLNRRSPREREEYSRNERYYKDIDHLQSALLKKAGQMQGTITLTRQDILDLAGWSDRFDFKARHVFPTPSLYFPIDITVQELNKALRQYNKGYLALTGTPGSGKSTLLTKTLRYRRNVRVVRYYCFVPDDTALSRGEAYNFLHDLVLTLYNEGIRARRHSIGNTIEELRTMFVDQIQEIGNLWKEKEQRTIVLIDGLDHIKRESNPERSLINELPQPSAIPDGCVFVLGTQRIDRIGLSNSITQCLEANNRTRIIPMGRLERRGIRKIISQRMLDTELHESDIEMIVSRSAGHPLALNYILNRISNADTTNINRVLNDIPEYADNIEREYEAYWQQLANDYEVRDLLAILSRVRGTLDLNIMSHLASENTLRKFVSSAKHYFIELPDDQWKFFHNSFRQFVLDQTGRNAFGIRDEKEHRKYHSELAYFASTEVSPMVFRWELLYHTFYSGDYKRVLELGNQGYFRNHYFSSRPANLIFDDTKLVMKAARFQDNMLAAIKILLIESELNQRYEILDNIEIHNLLYRVGKHEEAIKHVISEGQLYLNSKAALEFTCKLVDDGYFEAAKEIFELAEPLDKLSEIDSENILHTDVDILVTWVRAALRFRTFDNIKDTIKNLVIKEDIHNQNSRNSSDNLRSRLYIELADTVIEAGNHEEIEELPNKLSDEINEKELRQRIALSAISSDYDPDWKNDQLNYLTKLNGEEKLNDTTLLGIAAIFLREKNDFQTAKKIFKSINRPPRVLDESGYSHSFGPYVRLFYYYRLSTALGYVVEPFEAIEGTTDEHTKAKVLIARMMIRMANLWGNAWQGNVLPPSSVIHELLPALRIIELRYDSDLSLVLSGMHKQYLDILIYTTAAHGDDALQELSLWFEKRWQDPDKSKYWYNSLRRHAALLIYRAGGSKDELISRLTDLDPTLDAKEDVREYLESCTEQLYAWEEIGDLDRAYAYIRTMIKASFGIYSEKDPQIYYWTKWFQSTLEHNPEYAKSYYRFIVQGVATASAYSRGDRSHDASKVLLSITATIAPDLAERLKHRFWDEDALNYHTAIEAMIISGFTEQSVPIEAPYAILRRLYLPFVQHFEDDIIEAFINRLVEIDRSCARKLLMDLINAVKLEISPALCGKWWSSLDQYLRSHVDVAELLTPISELLLRQKPELDYTKGSVLLNDGTVIEEDELLSEGKNPDRLIEIVENIEKDTFYRWNSIIKNILSTLNKKQSERLLLGLTKIGKSGRNISGLIDKLLEFGDTKEAEKYALDELKQSKAYGWSYSYDGGTRIEPYKILVKINDKYRREAFNQFINDYLEGNLPHHIDAILHDVIEVFWRDYPIQDIWDEIYEHFSQLREFTYPVIKLSSDYELEQLNQTSLTQLLLYQLIEAYGMPLPELQEDAYKALIDLYNTLPTVKNQITQAIEKYLDEERDSPLLGTSLLRGVADISPELIDRFGKKLSQLLQHDDIAVRLASNKTLSRSYELQTIKRERTLPPSYTIKLPEFETLEDSMAGGLVAPNATLPETNDSLQLVGTAQEALEIIQLRTGLEYRNLVERTALLMKTILPSEDWNSKAEKALQERCTLLHIETAYRRPRAIASSIALGYVIGELFDTGRLDENDIYLLEPSLSILDLTIARKEPTAANLSPVSISIYDDYTQSLSTWAETEPDMLSTPPVRGDGWTILGFVTRADVPRWSHPSEYITGSICSPHIESTDIRGKPEAIIPGTMMALWWLADQYPKLPYLESALTQSLLIKAQAQRTQIGRASWLAINPIVTRKLGWSLNKEGLFKWCDSAGKTMVKTEWWRNGRLHRHAPADGVRSEGWVVKVSPDGFDQLREMIYPAKWVYGVKKCHSKNEADNTWISIFDLT